jgi:hypothetical protein
MITVSFLEIYNEVIKDLLNPSDRTLKIRESPSFGIYLSIYLNTLSNYLFIYLSIYLSNKVSM